MRSASSWMLAQLDYATRTHHVHADSPRISLLAGTITREKYEEYLARVFTFEAPIEARWRATVGLDSIVDVRTRMRMGFLIADLTTLGVRIPEVTEGAQFVGVEQALGWMYVVERGRRMNSLLYRHLTRRIPAVMAIGGNYLNASNACGMRWQQFGEALDRFATNHVIAEQIINAANRGFRSLQTQPRFATQPHAA